MAQVAALKYYLGDYNGVRQTINYFVTHQFLDQIAASGEQPYEAVRTRPFHYRCFNLEALIVSVSLSLLHKSFLTQTSPKKWIDTRETRRPSRNQHVVL